jgi:PII-like signaling protein
MLPLIIHSATPRVCKPLYEVIVYKAKKMNLAGVTVTRGIMGYGANSRIHTLKLLALVFQRFSYEN